MPSKTDGNADVLRRGFGRISPDKPFAIDFSDPHNPVRALTKDEQAAADETQAAANDGRKLREADRIARTEAGIAIAPAGSVTETGG